MTDALPRRVIAIIPARGGSKRIPAKNLLPVAGAPLVVHSIRHARAAASVTEVWVSTDDPQIAALAVREGARVVPRPAQLSSDTATSESALLHVLDARRAGGQDDPDLVVFLQPTSPARRRDDIDRAVDTLLRTGADSVFSACENSRLIWALQDDGPVSINYDYRTRQREQDMVRQYRENGSIYVFPPQLLRRTGNRLGGRMAVYEMDYWSSFQIDTPEHAELLAWIMRRPEFAPAVAWPARLELVIFDFDGVMTDNGVWTAEDGRELARCDRRDGLGVGMLSRAGVRTMIVSTEARGIAAARAAKLQIPCHLAIADKGAFVAKLLREQMIDAVNVAYVGNDVNDLSAMALVGFPVAVADAHAEVIAVAKLVLSARGGHGAVREFCELALSQVPAAAPAS